MKRSRSSGRPIRKRLAESGASRWRALMAAVMAVTAAAGFLASFTLLRAGVHDMAIRYPVAVAFAYLTFLFQVWVWVSWQRRRRPQRRPDVDLPDRFDVGDIGGLQPHLEVGGGSSGGAGATAHFETAPQSGASLTGSSGPGLELPEADELAVVLLALALALSAVVATGYLVWTAPTLFADALVDGVLAAGIYRRLRRSPDPSWVPGTLRKTWLPALAVAITALVVGLGLRHVAPGAHSIGDVWHKTFSGQE